MWNCSLFLAHWHKCSAFEHAQNSTWCWLWVFKVSCKIRVLKQSKSALLCCVSHITILLVFTCMMNVHDQTRQAFVASFCPFCDRTSKFLHRPWNVNFTFSSQVLTFQNNVWANCRQVSNWLIFIFFKLMVIHAWCCMLVLPNQRLSWFGLMFYFFPASLISSTYTDKNSPFSRLTNKLSQFGTFPQPCSFRTFSNCLSHNSPAKRWPCIFRSRKTTGSSILDHDLGHLCFGRRIQISGFWLWNF